MSSNKGYKTCPYLCQDVPTKVAHLGWRFFYTLIAFLILGYGISPGSGFFISLSLFTSALLMEYLRFTPDTRWRKLIRNSGIFVFGIFLLIGIVGIIGILNVVTNGDLLLVVTSDNFIVRGPPVALSMIWYILGISIVITLCDWVIYESPIEQNVIRDIGAKL